MVLILSNGCYFLHSYTEAVSEWAEVHGAMPVSEMTLFCSCLCLCLPLDFLLCVIQQAAAASSLFRLALTLRHAATLVFSQAIQD